MLIFPKLPALRTGSYEASGFVFADPKNRNVGASFNLNTGKNPERLELKILDFVCLHAAAAHGLIVLMENDFLGKPAVIAKWTKTAPADWKRVK